MIVGLDIGTSKVVAIVGQNAPDGSVEVIGIGSCPSKGLKRGVVVNIEVTVQADRKVKMSGYSSYTWLVSAAILNDTHGQWEPQTFDADTEIKYLIDRELRKRGMSERSVDPDAVVAFAAGIDMDALELQLDARGTLEALNVPKGGLVVLMLNARTGHLIWTGVATADVQGHPDVDTAKARLDYAVTKMFKLLPK